jgi:uncharacterized membrane protein YbaN (DUF454 family)
LKKKVWKTTLFAFGCISLLVGAVGLFIPLLPTTPFVILAAWLFMHSSPKAHEWVKRQKFLGHILAQWEEKGVIPKKAKGLAICMMIASIIVIWIRVPSLPIKIGVTGFLMLMATYVLTRPSD